MALITLTDSISMLNRWDFSGADDMCFGDENCESYKKAAEFIGKDQPVEDWGGGTAFAKHFFSGKYINIDGSLHKNVDIQADLVSYTSKAENILMRQVLECNTQWGTILENVKNSFTKKFCLVICTPFTTTTEIYKTVIPTLSDGTKVESVSLPEISFKKEDVLAYFPEKEFKVSEETIKILTDYGEEWILYVEKI
jgi:uncharacterized protein (UPF0254 family)